MERACFFESSPQTSLLRRMLVEGVGTFLLMLVLTGTALVIQQSSPSIPLLPRFTSAIAAAGALTGLVIALGSASGAHFNPLISGIQWLLGERSGRWCGGCSRSAKAEAGPFAIAAWLAAAIIVFPSGSYANPAIVLGSMFAAGPIKLQMPIGAWFIAVEVLGVLLAAATISMAYPRSATSVAVPQGQDTALPN